MVGDPADRLVRSVDAVVHRQRGPGTAALVEDLAAFAAEPGSAPAPRNLRESVRRSAEARARTCYDHLAGGLGVALADALLARVVVTEDSGLAVTAPGRAWLVSIGINVDKMRRSSRLLVRSCLDWTERRPTSPASSAQRSARTRWTRAGSNPSAPAAPSGLPRPAPTPFTTCSASPSTERGSAPSLACAATYLRELLFTGRGFWRRSWERSRRVTVVFDCDTSMECETAYAVPPSSR
ncbi:MULTISPECIES: hypothetical protein [Streptomyces]|uniref:Uncharacterized protein n=1 Tax=Streptomyces kasugaensis TaxID=1946 RepID=A0A4Q9HZG3_STRKA|nr:hypothetical protein [Streptomyces kasugaensis]TBO60727.1 hypothetical protein EYS09_04920 [Streptomyces kasugaensis]